MKAYFSDLFAYNDYVNQALLQLMLDHTIQLDNSVQSLINHIFNAHQIWNARILGMPTLEVWQINDWAILPVINTENNKESLKIVHTYELDKTIRYNNAKGAIFSQKIKDILFHIINHSTYHRAQIAMRLRESGITPLNTDYIYYKRSMER